MDKGARESDARFAAYVGKLCELAWAPTPIGVITVSSIMDLWGQSAWPNDTQPHKPSAAELAAVRELTHDLPALWRAQTTTQAERQTIVRLFLQRVLVEVVGGSETVGVECHWHGGVCTTHELTRPVARLASLSTYSALTARAAELRREGLNYAGIAERLNRLSCRNPNGRKRDKLVFADPQTVATLKAIRTTPPPWRRLPPEPESSRPTSPIDS